MKNLGRDFDTWDKVIPNFNSIRGGFTVHEFRRMSIRRDNCPIIQCKGLLNIKKVIKKELENI